MEVKLEASPKVLLSIYSPSGKIAFLEDSQERTLSRILPETGFYEFVVVSKASEPLEYQFTIIAENPPEVEPIPTETPITPTEEPTPTETPTDEID
jgi:serine/threonine-protein kinase